MSTPAPLTINLTHQAGTNGQGRLVCALVGNLDNATVPALQAKLNPMLATKPAQLIFDLAGLKYVTSAGIRVFFTAVKQQKASGGQTSFVNLPPQIQEVFMIMGNLPDMRIFKNQAELDEYLLARQRSYEQ
ncbi:MAG: hypothetical protein RJA22_2096 [Verrucomicrobiota bacterium]|jgi:anti-anti-sigma factor